MQLLQSLALLAVTVTQYGTTIGHRGGAGAHRHGREDDPDSSTCSSVASNDTPAGGWPKDGNDSDDEVTSYYTAPSTFDE
ncbi:hypothetical protein PspLS_08164 [Pyricularia sp. CBS 133598]|nr:hypothetical protein PspLS_08164 [Pyricularia sp. CBS 133598]